MPSLEIHQFPCLKDNYGVLVHDQERGVTASVDAPEAAAVEAALAGQGWKLTHIFVTHHHADHTGGISQLKAAHGCMVIGPALEAARIPGVDLGVNDDDRLRFGGFDVEILATPGHTIGHVSYYIPRAHVAFVGDTLFAMGCGRVLEGSAEMMWMSLERLARLPADTEIYCGHEYTLANARFALTIEPDNQMLQARAKEVEALRAAGQPTLPTTVALERDTNVFLRAGRASIRNHLGLGAAADWRVFAEIRDRKNRF